MTEHIFRVGDRDDFQIAASTGYYNGEAFDISDGFIHTSTRDQLAGTLHRHYADMNQVCLAIAEIDPGRLNARLNWEVSYNGERFPHIYGSLNWDAVTQVHIVHRNKIGFWSLDEIILP